MPIKLSDLTCEKCIYAYLISRNKDLVQCRRHTPDTWEKCNSDAWCGEGNWLTKYSEMVLCMTRESYFLTHKQNLEKDELVNPHEA